MVKQNDSSLEDISDHQVESKSPAEPSLNSLKDEEEKDLVKEKSEGWDNDDLSDDINLDDDLMV